MSFSTYADVVSRGGSVVLKVIKSEDRKSVSFEEWNVATNKLNRTLGPKKFYSYAEILSQRQIEAYQPPLAVAADVGLIIAVFISGGIAVRAITIWSEVSHILAVTAAGGILDGFIISTVDALNPHEQYQQHICLRDEVIMDKRVELESEEDIMEFNDSMETVLYKLTDGTLKDSFKKIGKTKKK